MKATLLGWPQDGPTIRLDYRRFAYAGKFVMSNTGKAVLREPPASTAEAPSAPRAKRDSETSSGSQESVVGTESLDFDDSIVAAVAFNTDRTEPAVCWIRYITVASDRRGEGLGPRLVDFVVDRAEQRGFDRCRIAVNNPFAYEAMYKAGFVYTGRQTGLAELVLERPSRADTSDRSSQSQYQRGLEEYRNRDLDDPEQSFLAERERVPPPAISVGERDVESGE